MHSCAVFLPPFLVLEWASMDKILICSFQGLFVFVKLRSHEIDSVAAASADSAPLILFHSFKGCTADFMAGRKLEKAQVLFH